MNFRSALTVMLIAVPLASTALAQMYPAPQPKSNPALTPPPTSTTTPAPAAPAAAAPEPAAPAAQTAAAAPTAAASGMPAVPPPNCVQPQYPGKSAPNERIKRFNDSYKEYGDCIRKYVDSVRTLAKTAVDSGNDAVTGYNNYTEEIKKQLDADK